MKNEEQIKNEIVEKLKKIEPSVTNANLDIDSGSIGAHFGRIEFDTDNKKKFSVGVIVYSLDNTMWTLTSSDSEIKKNLANFK